MAAKCSAVRASRKHDLLAEHRAGPNILASLHRHVAGDRESAGALQHHTHNLAQHVATDKYPSGGRAGGVVSVHTIVSPEGVVGERAVGEYFSLFLLS